MGNKNSSSKSNYKLPNYDKPPDYDNIINVDNTNEKPNKKPSNNVKPPIKPNKNIFAKTHNTVNINYHSNIEQIAVPGEAFIGKDTKDDFIAAIKKTAAHTEELSVLDNIIIAESQINYIPPYNIHLNYHPYIIKCAKDRAIKYNKILNDIIDIIYENALCAIKKCTGNDMQIKYHFHVATLNDKDLFKDIYPLYYKNIQTYIIVHMIFTKYKEAWNLDDGKFIKLFGKKTPIIPLTMQIITPKCNLKGFTLKYNCTCKKSCIIKEEVIKETLLGYPYINNDIFYDDKDYMLCFYIDPYYINSIVNERRKYLSTIETDNKNTNYDTYI